jgi:RNA polymerase II subunit A-like phosphatase
MKSQVLIGVHLVFSGVVPLGVDIHSHDTAVWAKSFGASVSENITRRTTHVVASPERRTAKVRQAAKKGGRIAIVSQGWLFACFSQWKKVDEDSYRIHSDAPTNGAAGLPNSFEGKDELVLSSSDDEATATEDEMETGTNTPNGVGLRLDIDTDIEDLNSILPSKDRADSSPTTEESPDNWASINDEMREFLGSDDESDAESVKSESLKTPPSERKRKRDALEEDGEQQDEDEGSRLQKRKKEALARSSSLTQMANLPSSSGSTPTVAAEDPRGGDGDEEEDDLEAMLMAEMEKDSDTDGG